VVIGLLILLGMLDVRVPEIVKHIMCAATAVAAILTMVFYYRAYLKAEKDEKEKSKRKKAGNKPSGGEAETK
jgi:secreted trypsin-like serine protease